LQKSLFAWGILAVGRPFFGLKERALAYSGYLENTDFNSGLFLLFHMKICDWSTENVYAEKAGCRIDHNENLAQRFQEINCQRLNM
jgi:hypothetical protein